MFDIEHQSGVKHRLSSRPFLGILSQNPDWLLSQLVLGVSELNDEELKKLGKDLADLARVVASLFSLFEVSYDLYSAQDFDRDLDHVECVYEALLIGLGSSLESEQRFLALLICKVDILLHQEFSNLDKVLLVQNRQQFLLLHVEDKQEDDAGPLELELGLLDWVTDVVDPLLKHHRQTLELGI